MLSSYSVSKGGLNKGLIITFQISCPSDCVCKSNKLKYWYHTCGEPLFLTEYGYLICKNHLKGCQEQFIKDFKFQCEKAKQSNNYYKYKSISQLICAIAQAIQQNENNLEEGELCQFTNGLMINLRKQW